MKDVLLVFAAIGSLFASPYAMPAMFAAVLVAMTAGIGRYLFAR